MGIYRVIHIELNSIFVQCSDLRLHFGLVLWKVRLCYFEILNYTMIVCCSLTNMEYLKMVSNRAFLVELVGKVEKLKRKRKSRNIRNLNRDWNGETKESYRN